MQKPLANKLKPQSLKEIVGQKHLIDKDGVIYKLVKKKKLVSLIFYGPSGIGKTSLANAIVHELNLKYRELNAVINNKKDFDIILEEAKMFNGLVVIIDEIHRLNKDKQDLLLPHIENGLITIIGLTNANPFHKINPAIRSRCQLFELYPLTEEEIKQGLKNTLKKEFSDYQLTKDGEAAIIKLANYDLRNAINTLELGAVICTNKKINKNIIEKINNKPIYLSDKNEDNYYDMLSAFQKSIRGGDVHASLYYLGRLIVQDDLDSIIRRLTVIVYEDIGLANPNLATRINLGVMACERVGFPEARIILSNLVIEMALAPKSNSAYLAINKVLSDIEQGASYPIPKHLKNHSQDYKYPHDYQFSYVKQQYLPNQLKETYYYPKKNQNENHYANILKKIQEKNR